jgi:hypothetical protein
MPGSWEGATRHLYAAAGPRASPLLEILMSDTTPESVLRELLTFQDPANPTQAANIRLRAASALFAHELDQGDEPEPGEEEEREDVLVIRVPRSG